MIPYSLVLRLHDGLEIEGNVLHDHAVLLHAGLRLVVPANNTNTAESNIREEWRRAFEGMQPTFKQVPPNVPRFSMQAVFSPS